MPYNVHVLYWAEKISRLFWHWILILYSITNYSAYATSCRLKDMPLYINFHWAHVDHHSLSHLTGYGLKICIILLGSYEPYAKFKVELWFSKFSPSLQPLKIVCIYMSSKLYTFSLNMNMWRLSPEWLNKYLDDNQIVCCESSDS